MIFVSTTEHRRNAPLIEADSDHRKALVRPTAACKDVKNENCSVFFGINSEIHLPFMDGHNFSHRKNLPERPWTIGELYFII